MVNIRWRKKDQTKLSRAVQKFNAKLTRLSKANPEFADAGVYPERLVVSELKQGILTRADFNRTIKSIDRFFKKDAADVIKNKAGIYTTKYEEREAAIDARRVTLRRKKQREESGISKHRAEKLNLEDVDISKKLDEIKKRLEPGKNNNTTPENERQRWRNFTRMLKLQSSDNWFQQKNEQYLQNYFRALNENLTPSQAQAIKKLIEDLGIDGYQLFLINQNNDLTDIDFVYSQTEADYRYETIMEQIPLTLKELNEEE